VKGENKGVSEVPKFRVNFLCTAYHCAIHNLLIFIGGRWTPPPCLLKRQAGAGLNMGGGVG